MKRRNCFGAQPRGWLSLRRRNERQARRDDRRRCTQTPYSRPHSALLPTAHPPDTDTNATRRPETTLLCLAHCLLAAHQPRGAARVLTSTLTGPPDSTNFEFPSRRAAWRRSDVIVMAHAVPGENGEGRVLERCGLMAMAHGSREVRRVGGRPDDGACYETEEPGRH